MEVKPVVSSRLEADKLKERLEAMKLEKEKEESEAAQKDIKKRLVLTRFVLFAFHNPQRINKARNDTAHKPPVPQLSKKGTTPRNIAPRNDSPRKDSSSLEKVKPNKRSASPSPEIKPKK
jgi:hypothetical protein